MKRIAFSSYKKAEVLDVPEEDQPLGSKEIAGRTLVSLVSPGTELNHGYLGDSFPYYPGYASIFEVEEIGSEVSGISRGNYAFYSGQHCEFQRAPADDVATLPLGLKPEHAVFARLMGVTMSTLNSTAAHPPARVSVTGLGPVGNLAAQIFAGCGYEVTAIDPIQSRREVAGRCGLQDVRSSFEEGPDLTGQVALHIECSGHEHAVLQGCKRVCKRGEVVLVGVPWKRRTQLHAFELLHAVFHRYVVLRSGWEWEIPRHTRDFSFHSIHSNYVAALKWLAKGQIQVEALAGLYPPSAAGEVYAGLMDQSLASPAAVFDWRK